MMATAPLSITLKFGIRVAPFEVHSYDAFELGERLIGGPLGVPFTWDEDNDLGGAYLEYAPQPMPAVGVTGVRILTNKNYDDEWIAEHRQDVALVAKIMLAATTLLEVGRTAAAIFAHATDGVVLLGYHINPSHPDIESELWRAHAVIFMTDAAGSRRWTPEQSAVGDDIRGSLDSVAPVLVGHVRFAVGAADWTAAVAAVQRVFPVAFTTGVDPEIGGDYLEHRASDGSSLLLRHTATNGFMRQLEGHKDVAFLLDVTMRTQSLLDLGRLAAVVEAQGGFEVIADRAVGDLVRDRVPRVLIGSGPRSDGSQP